MFTYLFTGKCMRPSALKLINTKFDRINAKPEMDTITSVIVFIIYYNFTMGEIPKKNKKSFPKVLCNNFFLRLVTEKYVSYIRFS